jgi:hypothetical protein
MSRKSTPAVQKKNDIDEAALQAGANALSLVSANTAQAAAIENDRVIRYTCTDHTTGTVQVRYYAGAETGLNLADFFIHCIQSKDDSQQPIHGVPFI